MECTVPGSGEELYYQCGLDARAQNFMANDHLLLSLMKEFVPRLLNVELVV